MKNTVLLLICMVLSLQLTAENVTVKLKADSGFANQKVVATMEHNLSQMLTEINDAFDEKRPLVLDNISMNDFAKGSLRMLWSNVYFYCDDDYVVDRLWNFSDGFMARSIPIIITPGEEEYNSGVFQEAVVEFGKNGSITDFRFAIDAAVGESMEQGGDVVDIERRMQILAYCDRFRTAYNTKDIQFLEQVFSDDALIITGKVVTSRKGDTPLSPKVSYKKYDKQQYLTNLRRVFARNSWIDVKFSQIGDHGEGDGERAVTRSTENPNIYGVRLRQEWNSSTYSDEGYVFLLWDFTDEEHPVIHVRTWQPEYVGANKLPEDEIFTIDDFVK
ncbi:MAG: hypothetical protein K6A28_00155 [Bacteroidales bacterium]|nr:hypothetical protein [Bacteroidales bacterium]